MPEGTGRGRDSANDPPEEDPPHESGSEDDFGDYVLPSQPSFPGKQYLSGSSPSDVLRRLIDGDPLELYERSLDVQRELAFLIATERLFYRVVARTAHAALFYDGNPPLDEWLRERIDQSIRDLIQEDLDGDTHGTPPGNGWEAPSAIVQELDNVEPGIARAMCVSFNTLADHVRQAYWCVVLEGETILDHSLRTSQDSDDIEKSIGEAMLALLLPSMDDQDESGGN